jgi:nucleoside 2-deoxyribosyltransferase
MTNPSQKPPAEGSPVYCSGPMFSVGDKGEQLAVATALEGAGFTTYLPQRDGIEVGRVMQLVGHPLLEGFIADKIMQEVRKWVFALDMYQLLDRCQALVFNLDGRTPDDGSVVETAAAFTAGKPIVIYKTSPITMLAGADNPMVEGLSGSWTYVDDVTAVPAAVVAAVAAFAKQPYAYGGPPNVAALIKEGEEVWDALSDMRSMPTDPKDLIKWLEEIAKQLLGGGGSGRFARTAPQAQPTH